VPSEPQPVVHPRFVVGVAVFAAYVLAFVLSRGSHSWVPFLLLLALGFVLGAVTSSWWAVAVGVLAASVGGEWLSDDVVSDFGGAWLPGAIAFGVLGARLRESEEETPTAGGLATVGAVLLGAGLLGFLVFAVGYNDDTPVSPFVGWGFIVMALALPFGLGLLCAGILGMSRR
jgi:hypothetical protein